MAPWPSTWRLPTIRCGASARSKMLSLRGDLLFGNFETPISVSRQPAPGAPGKFFSPQGMARVLRDYGFDVVNLAHNHIYDFGTEGVEATIAELEGAGLPHVGIGRDADHAARPVVVTSRNGVKVGFLAYTTAHNALREQNEYVACFPEPQRVARDVERLAAEVATVIVSCPHRRPVQPLSGSGNARTGPDGDRSRCRHVLGPPSARPPG